MAYLLHLVQTLPQVLIEIRFHSGHDALQLDPFIQQLPVVLNGDKRVNTPKNTELCGQIDAKSKRIHTEKRSYTAIIVRIFRIK